MTGNCVVCGAHHADGACPPDPIKHPAHYTQQNVRQPGEVIDVIEAWDVGHHLSCTLKYIARFKHKGGVLDLKKARWYLNRFIWLLETGQRVLVEENMSPPPAMTGSVPGERKTATEVAAYNPKLTESLRKEHEEWAKQPDWKCKDNPNLPATHHHDRHCLPDDPVPVVDDCKCGHARESHTRLYEVGGNGRCCYCPCAYFQPPTSDPAALKTRDCSCSHERFSHYKGDGACILCLCPAYHACDFTVDDPGIVYKDRPPARDPSKETP